MKLYMFLSAVFAFLLNGCANEKNEQIIKISGNIANFKAKKIYLTDAFRWNIFLDSAVCYNGHFEFVLDSSQFREPFIASLCTLNQQNKIEQLPIINYKKTAGKDTFASTGFSLSWGTTEISGDYKTDNHRFSISRNSENDLYFDPKTENFASNKNLSFIKKIIRKHPGSYFLLQQVHRYKLLYSTDELHDILSFFDNKLLGTKYALETKLYAGYASEKKQLLPKIYAMTLDHQSVDVLGSRSKLYMLIFLASWCGPCRNEIPQLKKLNAKYTNYDLRFKSISIDSDSLKWQRAVNDDRMPWEQLLIAKDDLFKFNAQFNLGLVPTVVFINADRKIIRTYTGYHPENMQIYSRFIDSFFAKNN